MSHTRTPDEAHDILVERAEGFEQIDESYAAGYVDCAREFHRLVTETEDTDEETDE